MTAAIEAADRARQRPAAAMGGARRRSRGAAVVGADRRGRGAVAGQRGRIRALLRQLTEARWCAAGGEPIRACASWARSRRAFPRADRMIISGSRGVWPRGLGIDTFLSRPMRDKSACRRRSGASACRRTNSRRPPAPCGVLLTPNGAAVSRRSSAVVWRLETLLGGAARACRARGDLDSWLRRSTPPIRRRRRRCARRNVRIRNRGRGAAAQDVGDARGGVVRDPYATYARYVLDWRPCRARTTGRFAAARAPHPRGAGAFRRGLADMPPSGPRRCSPTSISRSCAAGGCPSRRWRARSPWRATQGLGLRVRVGAARGRGADPDRAAGELRSRPARSRSCSRPRRRIELTRGGSASSTSRPAGRRRSGRWTPASRRS